jgi:uncharacterized repeat protein (TIGR03943 family)
MSQRPYRILQALILAGLGGLLLQRLFDGTLFYYINQRFFPLVLLGAAGLLLLVPFILRSARLSHRDHLHESDQEPGRTRDRVGEHEDDHEEHLDSHSHESPRSRVWILLTLSVPLFLGFVIPASPLGASAIPVKGIETTLALDASSDSEVLEFSLPADERTILDWIRAFNYAADPVTLEGESADVIGFVYRDERLRDDEFLVGRFTLTCCVADAFAIGLVIQWPEAAELADNTWVRVKGSVRIDQEGGQKRMYVAADSVREIEPPDQPYLFP